MIKKKLLTLDNLYDFYLNQNKTCTFSAKESGYQVSVQIPTKFEISEENKDDTLLFCTVKLMHSGENRNHSCVTDEALYKAGNNLAYKPILANFMEYVDETTGETLKDFTAHDMEINDDGTVTYYEKQIGCFTSDEPYYEVEEETGHNFLYGKCAIPREYSDACSIIERKNGTKISVELLINEMKYNSKSKVLELTDVIIQGATCLGKNPENLEDVGEGMLNARLDIADFSVENNSVKFNKDEKLIDLLDKLNTTLSNFNDTNNSKKGGNNQNMTILEKLLAKYNKTVEDITFEYEDLSDDELTAKFEKVFGESDDEEKDDVENTETPTSDENTGDTNTDDSTDNNDSDDNSDNTVTENNACGGAKKKKKCGKDNLEDDPDDEPEVKENNACGGSGSAKKKKKNSVECSYVTVDGETKTYAVSLDEKISAIHCLVNDTYAESDNTYYGVRVYDSYVVMEDWCTGRYFKQTYTDNNDVYTLTGDRVEVYAEFVTSEELSELESMRSNYSELKEFKENIEKNELHTQKEEIINSEKYAVIAEKDEEGKYTNEAFAKLVSEMDNYSLTDLETQIKVIHSDYIAENSNFSIIENKTTVSKKQFSIPSKKETKNSRYGKLFEK